MNNYSHSDALRRRQSIMEIVRRSPVHSQEELAEALAREHFHVAQPTLSRDVRELGLIKTPAGYVASSTEEKTSSPVVAFSIRQSAEHRLDQILDTFAITVEQAGNLIVVRTAVAGAQPLAVAIDGAALPEIAGTIAGDDTIFIAVRTAAAARRITARLRSAITPSRSSRRNRA